MQEINGSLGIIILLIGFLLIIAIGVLIAKIDVMRYELLEKDESYAELYDSFVIDITRLTNKNTALEKELRKLQSKN